MILERGDRRQPAATRVFMPRLGDYGIVTLLRAMGESPAAIGRNRKR